MIDYYWTTESQHNCLTVKRIQLRTKDIEREQEKKKTYSCLFM